MIDILPVHSIPRAYAVSGIEPVQVIGPIIVDTREHVADPTIMQLARNSHEHWKRCRAEALLLQWLLKQKSARISKGSR